LDRYTRLELLEGVVAYHTGLLEESFKALTTAQAKYQQLFSPNFEFTLTVKFILFVDYVV